MKSVFSPGAIHLHRSYRQRYVPISLIIAFFVVACSSDKKEPEQEAEATKSIIGTDTSKVISAFKDFEAVTGLTKSYFTDPFDVPATTQVVSYLMGHNTSLLNMGKKSIGGVFDASLFKIQAPNTAVRLWYCYNPNNTNYPALFMAVEQIEKYDTTDVMGKIGSTLRVAEVFPYTQAGFSPQEVETFLTTTTFPSAGAKTITDKQVVEYATNFLSLISIISPDPRMPYIAYPVGVFENNKSYQDFMSRNPDRICYFTGLAMIEGHKPNYLRPVLGGLDKNGKLITTTAADGTKEGLLQNSWPPPPWN